MDETRLPFPRGEDPARQYIPHAPRAPGDQASQGAGGQPFCLRRLKTARPPCARAPRCAACRRLSGARGQRQDEDDVTRTRRPRTQRRHQGDHGVHRQADCRGPFNKLNTKGGVILQAGALAIISVGGGAKIPSTQTQLTLTIDTLSGTGVSLLSPYLCPLEREEGEDGRRNVPPPPQSNCG